MQVKGFPGSVNLVKRFDGKRPPVVPYSLQLIADDLVYRTSTNIFNPNPLTMRSLFSHSLETISHRTDEIQRFLTSIMNEKKPGSEAVKTIMRINVTGKYNTATVLGGLIEFFNRCEDGINVTLTYPVDTWLIMGASSEEFRTDETRYTREVDAFLREYAEVNGVHKDFFCFIMQMLTNILAICVTNHKPNMFYPGLVTYIMAQFFAPRIVKVRCHYCHTIIEADSKKNCAECRELLVRCGHPLSVRVIVNILSNIPSIFWNNCVNNPRPGVLIRRNGDQIRRAAFKTTSPISSPRPGADVPTKAQTLAAIFPHIAPPEFHHGLPHTTQHQVVAPHKPKDGPDQRPKQQKAEHVAKSSHPNSKEKVPPGEKDTKGKPTASSKEKPNNASKDKSKPGPNNKDPNNKGPNNKDPNNKGPNNKGKRTSKGKSGGDKSEKSKKNTDPSTSRGSNDKKGGKTTQKTAKKKK